MQFTIYFVMPRSLIYSIARMPGFEGALPVNSVTALVGAPVVMSVLFNKRRNEMNE